MRTELLPNVPTAVRGLALCAAATLLSGPAYGIVLDDFSGGLSNFTGTVILDDNGGASNTSSWTIANGELSLDTTSYDGIEQLAFIYDGAFLEIGQELRADFSSFPITGNRNLGLYVGGTAPTAGVRQDYITVYGGTNSTVASRGFDGTSEYNNPGADGTNADALFIARTGENTFDVGFYEGAVKTVITTRTPTTPNTADYLGFYADVRVAGTIGFADNLEIFPDTVFDPADVNDDGSIDELDYFVIRDNLYETEIMGLPVTKGDGDIVVNGVVDLADFRFWKDSAPTSALIAAGLAVPEPSGVALLCLGAFAASVRGGKRR